MLLSIVRTYKRTAYHLQVLTLADADGRRQTLRLTDEHPFYRTAPAVGGSAGVPGWTPARSLAAGDEVLGDCGVLTVVANAGEAHRQGVKVYNLEVEQAHTYFVVAEHAPAGADAVWVHNADPNYGARGAIKEGLVEADRLSVQRNRQIDRIHGNRLDAPGEHSIYGIIDNSTGELLHIGESGNLLDRIARHQSDFAKIGITDISHIVLDKTEGKAAAKLIETDLIHFFRDKLGYALPYNFSNH